MSWFQTILLGLSRIYSNGVSVARRQGVNFVGNVSVTENDALDAYDIEFPGIPFGTQDTSVAGNIASGSVTIASDLVVLTAESGTSDTLTTISTSLPVGSFVVLKAASGHSITIINADNILTGGVIVTGNYAAVVMHVAPGVWQVLNDGGLPPAVTTATVVNGVIAFGSPLMMIDTEGAAPTDDLVQITGGFAGQKLILYTTDTSRDIVINHTTYIRTHTANDVTLGSASSRASLVCRSPGLWSLLSVAS